MELGSFIGLDLRDTGEFYKGETNIARLNSARAGIYHSCKLYNCNAIYIPYYLCPSVKKFLEVHGVTVKPYFINNRFEPRKLNQKENHAFLLVNYFGIISSKKIHELATQFRNVIIDNSAAFYSEPLNGCYNVYSPRKFFGVPDGCYVIGDNAEELVRDYEMDFSSPTASFLFKRLEYSTKETYSERMKNEERIDASSILRMSQLTTSLLKNIDYLSVKSKRQKNFLYAKELYKDINAINLTDYFDNSCVPLVYPLLVRDTELDMKLRIKGIYTGRWWKSVLNEVSEKKYEAFLSRNMIPIPIDQRYGMSELRYCYDIIRELAQVKLS